MMIDSGDVKDIAVEVIKTESKNQLWVVFLLVVLILSAGNFFFYSREQKARDELAIQKSLNLTDSKDCLKQIREAEKNKDIEYTAKLDNMRDTYNKELNDKAIRLEKDLARLQKKLGI